MPKLIIVLASLALLFSARATQVSKCKDRKIDAPKAEDVDITNCEKPPCRLVKKTEPVITMKITPQNDSPGVTTRVNGIIAGIPFPFIGVDGTSACDHIYTQDGKTKAGCPLKAGETYVYRNSFQVLDIYPKIKVTVHWGLINNQTNADISCFEVSSKIV